jgi:thioredoxin 1
LKTTSNFKDIISSNPLVLVDFHAVWCGPCKVLAPILKEVKEEIEDAVKIIKVDVDMNKPLAARYKVMGVPTLILFSNGQQVWRQSGVVPKHELLSLLKSKLV